MDKLQLKQCKVSRGFTYCYYRYSSPDRTKPTLLFLHGFPSTKEDWIHQIEYFVSKGFSIIAADTLGYGGSSKPTDVEAYRATDMAKDITEVLDFEHEGKVVVIAHDWGTRILGRIVDHFQDYLIAAVFLDVGYTPQPTASFDWEQVMESTKLKYGYSTFGYWQFFGNTPGSYTIMEKNIDSLYSLSFPHDPILWKTDFGPRGKAQEWIEGNKQAPRAAWWDEETMRAHQRRLLSGGLQAPLLYYKIIFTDVDNRPGSYSFRMETVDCFDRSLLTDIPPPFAIPTLLICCNKDYIAVGATQIEQTQMFAQNLTVEEFDCGHWIMFEKTELLNKRLDQFLGNLKSAE